MTVVSGGVTFCVFGSNGSADFDLDDSAPFAGSESIGCSDPGVEPPA